MILSKWVSFWWIYCLWGTFYTY